jgi:hypothetical protein
LLVAATTKASVKVLTPDVGAMLLARTSEFARLMSMEGANAWAPP